MSEYKTLLDQWFNEVWHKGNENAITELMASDAVIHGLDTAPGIKGPDAFKPFYEKFHEAFPVIEVDLDHLIKTSEFEAAYCKVKGKNAEKKNVQFNGIVIGRFKNGKLVECWNAFDFLTMYQQLGLQLVGENEQPKKDEEGYTVLESGLGIDE
jgi:predicted ester cyclase